MLAKTITSFFMGIAVASAWWAYPLIVVHDKGYIIVPIFLTVLTILLIGKVFMGHWNDK